MVMVTFRLMRMDSGDDDQLPPLVEPPPVAVGQSHSANRSIETLVVVLAVITIVAVIAGFIARLCGGTHYGGNGGDHEVEGCIESRCRSCIDAGISTAAPPPAAAAAPPKEEPNPAKEEAKK
ncbi:unnamed protein product [Lactuca virosa]|uniref:Uncharacterized protein n=1 Tax=Lactuca virosa TaxID=75947 RepID=A0AAU9P6P1_9ASTR|nr:unnamed protein product [Lactuca virosa]